MDINRTVVTKSATTGTTETGSISTMVVDTVSSRLFDEIFETFNPHKIVVIVSAEDEDEYRTEYEKIYSRYGNSITLYAGDVSSLYFAYANNHPLETLYTVFYE